MTDNDLPSALAALRPPAPSQPAAARALFRATIALGHAAATRHDAPPSLKDDAPRQAASSPFRRLLFFPSLVLPALAVLLLVPLFLRTPPARPVASTPADHALGVRAQPGQHFPRQHAALTNERAISRSDR